MPVDYYSSSLQYPAVYVSTVDRVLLYIYGLLYPSETYVAPGQPTSRLIRASFGSDENIALKNNIEQFKTSQSKFPFTAYNLNEMVPVTDKRSHLQKNHKFFDVELNCYISSQPTMFDIDMMSFFTTPNDYLRARALIDDSNVNLKRLWVPIKVNNIDTSFPIDISFEVNKFSLSWEFEEYLKAGRIFDIQHNCKVYVHNIIADVNITPVEDLVFSVNTMLEDETNKKVALKTATPAPSIKKIIPADKATAVVNNSPITITFNTPVDYVSILNNLDIVPKINNQYSFSSDCMVFTITPTQSWIDSTLYTISIGKNLASIAGKLMGTDFTSTFTVATNTLLISTSSPLTALKDTSYSQTLSATGGTGPYSWELDTSSIIPGLTLSSSGILSGIPIMLGFYEIIVRVTDSLGERAQKTLIVNVNNPALAITTPSTIFGING